MTANTTASSTLQPDAMLPRPFRVTSTRADTIDTVTLGLEAEDGGGIDFVPGQFTMLYVFGVGEVPISISGDPSAPETLMHTVRAVGAVTEAICRLTVGDQVGIRGPYGTRWPVEEAAGKDVVVAAGGIGLAPVRPMLLALLAQRSRFGAVSLIYGSRTPEDLLFVDELHLWRSRFDVEIEVTVDRAGADWLGDVGVVTSLLPRVPFQPEKTVAVVCGPEIMMRVTAEELAMKGVSPESIYLSMERNMKCAIGFCGHCQFGPEFICRDGPVFVYERLKARIRVPSL
jgi:NAD(P)H-flavin reductase